MITLTPARFLGSSLVSGSIMLAVCIILRPAGLTANDGISYYDGSVTTIVPYILALYSCVLGTWWTAQMIDGGTKLRHRLAMSLQFIAILIVSLVAAPHTIVNHVHTAIGAAIFSFQLVLTAILTVKFMPDLTNFALWIIELAAGIACAIYLPTAHGYLLEFQIIFQFAAWAIIIRTLAQL